MDVSLPGKREFCSHSIITWDPEPQTLAPVIQVPGNRVDDLRGEAAEKGSRKGKNGGGEVEGRLSKHCWPLHSALLGRLPETAAGNPAFLLVVLELNAEAHTPARVYWTACLVCWRFQMWSVLLRMALKWLCTPDKSFCPFLPSTRVMAVHQHAQAKGSFWHTV